MSQTELVGPDELLVPEDVQLLSWLSPMCCLAVPPLDSSDSVSSEPGAPPHSEYPCKEEGRAVPQHQCCCSFLLVGAASSV